MTAFYEQHYVCFCRSIEGQWILFDDGARRFVGRTFTDVKEKCVAGRLHPMLLFFEREKRSKTPPRFKGDRKEEKKEAEKKEVEKPPARKVEEKKLASPEASSEA